MANPLTLYVLIKQDQATQEMARSVYENFAVRNREPLNRFEQVHYARFVLIPNPGVSPDQAGILAICVITTFDGPMNPYLKFFWDDLRQMFDGITEMALHPGAPITNFTEFVNFINDHNLSVPIDLYQAYDYTVKQIWAHPPPPTT
jgi:hypothetical protein